MDGIASCGHVRRGMGCVVREIWARARRNIHELHEKQRQGGVSASKKLLAAIAVLAVAFAVFAAIPAVADDSDAAGATYYVDGTVATTGDGSEKTPFKTITEALAKNDVSKVVLKGNVDEYVTISDKKNVTLDLNGFILTNETATDSSPAAKGVIVNNGILTIQDAVSENR
mgnify:CR=1 FL=1